MRYAESRRDRRARERREAAEAQERKLAARDPRSGDDRRQAERRADDPPLTPRELDARLRALGISTDRRKGQRRGGDRRR